MVLLSFDMEEFDVPREHGVDFSLEEGLVVSVVDSEIKRTGYLYNSSLNPTFILGRYMHVTSPRTLFMNDGMMQIPVSVTPWLRFPLFWLSLLNLPKWLYHRMARRVFRHDGYFVTYFYPWEFYELKVHPEFNMPLIFKNHSGQQIMDCLDHLVKMLKQRGHEFITYKSFFAYETRNNRTPGIQ